MNKLLTCLCIVALLALLSGCTGGGTTATTEPAKAVNPDIKVTHTVALKVPDMHCPHACWPNVQETLAAEPGVGTLQLAAQQKEGVIDNPVVYVGADDKFDLQHAITALADKGFKDSVETKN